MPQTQQNSNIDITRKRLMFRSWHRGTREMDLLLGRFADAHVADFTAEELAQYDALLQNPDPDIYNWVSGSAPVPEEEQSAVTDKLVAFYLEHKSEI